MQERGTEEVEDWELPLSEKAGHEQCAKALCDALKKRVHHGVNNPLILLKTFHVAISVEIVWCPAGLVFAISSYGHA